MSYYRDDPHRLLARAHRLYRLLELGAPREIVDVEMRLVQEAIEQIAWPLDREYMTWTSRRHVRRSWMVRAWDQVLDVWDWLTARVDAST